VLRVRLFGLAAIEMDGRPVKLKPLTVAVLIRLIVADGAPVTVDALFRDCWPPAELVVGEYRTQVQKRILEIRRALDPQWSSESGEQSRVLPTQRGRVTAYQLVADREAIDVFLFADLIAQARRAATEDRIGLLERAMALWTGQPLLDVGDQPWADQLVRQLVSLRQTAEQELTHAYQLAGRAHDALDAAEGLAARSPRDPELASWVETLRDQVRASRGKRLYRKDLASLKTALVVLTDDLFGQDDANLVAGFCDTFDTDTDRNIIISRESTQGGLLHRVYGGNRDQLDRDLRTALSRTPKVAVETRSAKPRGKLTRYPVGTVATLHHATRRVFAVAYSRMGNDLMAQSSPLLLQASLTNLWGAVYRYGQLKPVAMPLVGSGLSRTDASYEELLTLIVNSFVASARAHYLTPELRVVIPQSIFDTIDIPGVLKSLMPGTLDAPGYEGNGEMTADNHTRDAADLRSSTLAVVQYTLRLKLPQAAWERVCEIIETAITATAAGDLESLRKAGGELMLVSPVRIIKGDGPPSEPADQKVFERANVLIDSLQSMRPASAEDADGKDR
jgi:DNA-binding SARP family transcriptional activator